MNLAQLSQQVEKYKAVLARRGIVVKQFSQETLCLRLDEYTAHTLIKELLKKYEDYKDVGFQLWLTPEGDFTVSQQFDSIEVKHAKLRIPVEDIYRVISVISMELSHFCDIRLPVILKEKYYEIDKAFYV